MDTRKIRAAAVQKKKKRQEKKDADALKRAKRLWNMEIFTDWYESMQKRLKVRASISLYAPMTKGVAKEYKLKWAEYNCWSATLWSYGNILEAQGHPISLKCGKTITESIDLLNAIFQQDTLLLYDMRVGPTALHAVPEEFRFRWLRRRYILMAADKVQKGKKASKSVPVTKEQEKWRKVAKIPLLVALLVNFVR